jgi:hypothetical protein
MDVSKTFFNASDAQVQAWIDATLRTDCPGNAGTILRITVVRDAVPRIEIDPNPTAPPVAPPTPYEVGRTTRSYDCAAIQPQRND